MKGITASIPLAFGLALATAVAIAAPATDLNGDARSDLLYRNASTGQVSRLLMNGFTIVSNANSFRENDTDWQAVGEGDFNGDGITDLLYHHNSFGISKIILFGAGGAPVSGDLFYTEANPAWKIVMTTDLNGDGKSDIVWWNSITGQVYAMLMNGFTIVAQGGVYAEPNRNWRIVAAGDFSGSGKANQLLWRNNATGQVYLMTVTYGAGGFSQSGTLIYAEPNTAWKIVAAADFNGDGKSDILWRNDTTGQVYMMLMNGASIASAGQVYIEPNLAWKIVATGDYNGDGKADLLWRNDTTGQVYMMTMNGLAITAGAFVYTEPDLAAKLLGPAEYGVFGAAQGPDFTGCASTYVPPPEMLSAYLGGYGNPLIQRQKSQQVVAIPLPAITLDGVHSGVIQFGEAAGAATPQPVRLEFSINKCPGVFESPVPSAPSGEFCNVDSTNGNYNAITWFAKPFSTIQNIQSASAYGYCWAGDADKKYYVNARWTYSSCAFGYPTCGFAIQQNQGPY